MFLQTSFSSNSSTPTCILPFFPALEEITSDQWVCSILKERYTIKFVQTPPLLVFVTPTPSNTLRAEVDKPLNVIEWVPLNDRGCRFYLRYFKFPRRDSSLWLTLNLSALNDFIAYKKFWMVLLMSNFYSSVATGWQLWMQDTYFHIMILPAHWK